MRLQLAAALVGVAVAATGARADGTITARGAYWKERSTRVMQPMLDGIFEVGESGLVNGHFLVDAITSASASAGAATTDPFTERRYEGGLGYTYNLGRARVGATAKYSTESDYKSFYVGVRGEVDLAQKNTTLGLGGGTGSDSVSGGTGGGLGQVMLVCEPGAADSESCDLHAYNAFATASQILSKNAVIGVAADLASLHGYQSNPYRRAVVDNTLVAEQHPTERLRQSYAVSLRYYVPQTKTTIIGDYRLYRDNWLHHDSVGAGAHTPELRVVQQVGDSADASIRYRYHTQNRAYFYQERYDMPQTYVSDDVKLDDFSTHTLEAKLGIFGEAFGFTDEAWAGARIEGILSYVAQQNRFGNAISGQLALTLPLAY